MSPLPVRIETRRLVLRPPDDRDAPEIVRQLSSYRISKWLGRVPHPYVALHARRWLAHEKAQRVKGLDLGFAIAMRSKPDRIIGAIGCHDIGSPEPVVGYWLAERHWGKGYMSEALAALLEALFAIAPDARPAATTLPDNRGSIGVLEKAGFRRLAQPAMHRSLSRRRKVRVVRFAFAVTLPKQAGCAQVEAGSAAGQGTPSTTTA
jgi:8-oxo-dGTP diphosphatase